MPVADEDDFPLPNQVKLLNYFRFTNEVTNDTISPLSIGACLPGLYFSEMKPSGMSACSNSNQFLEKEKPQVVGQFFNEER